MRSEWVARKRVKPPPSRAPRRCYLAGMSRRHGFTLLEILIAVTLGLMLLLIAVPSLSGMFREQKLRDSFQKFDAFVRGAQSKAIAERRTFVMVWDKEAIDLVALDPAAAANPPEESAVTDPAAGDRFPLEGGKWALERPAALVKKPIWEWPFWRSGLCEPAIVHFESDAGSWSAEYSGLTGRGKITAMDVK